MSQDLVKSEGSAAAAAAEGITGKRKGGGASRGLLKRMKATLMAKDSRTKTTSKLSVKEEADAVTAKAAKIAAEVPPDVQTVGVVAETGPRPDFSLWTVEDDLLLKNSMEAGAAMEALAKGAMRFSRRFTIRELRERWRALLYDPDISAKAAARMVEAEALILGSSKLTFSSKHKDSQDTSKKRRHRSVRTGYYKRRSLEEESVFCSFIDGFMQDGFEGPNDFPYNEAGEATDGQATAVDIPSVLVVGVESPGRVSSKEGKPDTEDWTLSQMVSLFASEGATGVLGAPPDLVEVASKASDVLEQNVFAPSEHGCDLNETKKDPNDLVKLEEVCDSHQRVSTLLLNAKDNCETQEEVSVFKDAEDAPTETIAGINFSGKIFEAASRQDSAELALQLPDTILASETTNYQENDYNASGGVILAADPQQIVPDLCTSEFQECSMRTTIYHEFMICTLNTEDTDVPFFEDPPSPSLSLSSSSLASSGYQSGFLSELQIPPEFNESSHLLQAVDETVENSEMMQDNEHTNATLDFLSANLCEEPMRRGFAGPKAKSVEAKEGSTKKRGKNSPKRSGSVNLLQSDTELLNPCFSEAQTNCKSTTNSLTFRFLTAKGASLAKQHEPQSLVSTYCTPLTTSTSKLFGQTTVQHDGCSSDAQLQNNQAEKCLEDSGKQKQAAEEEASSDEELAHFSDVEALILDMDLDPGDDDFSARAESRRTYKNHRRTLIRLEQGANSAMQRTLMLQGAIAILYGHHLRYFITENEVTIGRFTQDNVVDIDLCKEGRANKVSRRQASIKLKEDGVFYLKNLGRRVLYVNNFAIEKSQRASLNSNCLIEVGGMRFIFEINKKLAKKRVEEMLNSSYDE
ncbi:hypothetical protein O6H91_08G106700 [Diphasiastrum complanatum]|uniref:Uncharacterized protein n=1 Tax=Diphasiastrum complanatum TaxID=34168 RepID=A0ACC2D0W1_DIPCM|nr:hypothetical protein O6H91_08G106700 [Diphasiastrum complanatum]